MRFGSCAREKEVADLLERGHWPQACTPELHSHVKECRSCADLVLVTQTFRAARVQTAALPRLEPAGALWWRAQLRRRNTAIKRIGKPLLGAQVFALAISLIVAAGWLTLQARQGFRSMAWLKEFPRSLHLEMLLPSAMPKLDANVGLLVALLATLALVSGVVVYMTSEKQ